MHKVLRAPCKGNVRRRKRRPCHVQPGQQLHSARRSGFCKRRHAGQRRSPAFTPTPSLHTKECTCHAIFICITSFLTPKQIQCTSEGKPWAKSKCSPERERERERLQLPFDPSVGSLCHPCITTTHLAYSFLSLKLPPPLCAVLLVSRYGTKLSPCHSRSLTIHQTVCYEGWCLLLLTRQQDPRLLICQEIVDDLDARQTRIVAIGSLNRSGQDQEPPPLHRENMGYAMM